MFSLLHNFKVLFECQKSTNERLANQSCSVDASCRVQPAACSFLPSPLLTKLILFIIGVNIVFILLKVAQTILYTLYYNNVISNVIKYY